MPSNKPLASRRALRALAEGAHVTLELLADAVGRTPEALRRQARLEGWKLDRAPDLGIAERVRGVAAMLLRRVEVLGQRAGEEGGRIDKAEIDGMLAIVRGLDKIGEIMRPQEAAQENQIGQDEELAAVLERIDERIIELARELAAQMGEEEHRARRGVAGEGGVVA
jgi:hypothetical protein